MKPTLDTFTACSIVEGFDGRDDHTSDEIIAAWQFLINSGDAFRLQGWYGREAMRLIDLGHCILPAHVYSRDRDGPLA
jgi:hypothetical protein